jgi:hypothetical protein
MQLDHPVVLKQLTEQRAAGLRPAGASSSRRARRRRSLRRAAIPALIWDLRHAL